MTHQPIKGLYEKGPTVRNWQNRKYRVFKRDKWKCVYCPKQWKILAYFPIEIFWRIAPENRPTVDHVVPICKKGGNKIENLVTSCQKCNEKKGSKIIK